MEDKNKNQANNGMPPQGSVSSGNKVIAPSASFLKELNTQAVPELQQTQEHPQANESSGNAPSVPAYDPNISSGATEAPVYSKTPPRVDTESIYPTANPFSNTEYARAASSSRGANNQAEKLGLFSSIPTGIIVIAALTVIGAILQLFAVDDSTTASQSSNAQLIGAFISIGLAVGLFFLKNIVRIFFLILATLSVGSGIVGFIGTADIQQQYNSRKDTVVTEVRSLENKRRLSSQEEFALERLRGENAYYEQFSGAKFAQAYLLWLVSIGYNVFVIVYLLRPSIKDRFTP